MIQRSGIPSGTGSRSRPVAGRTRICKRARPVAGRMPAKTRIKPKPKKVLFLCTMGEQASLNAQIAFANLLNRKKNWSGFELSRAGVDNLPPKTSLLQLISRHDFVVTCNPHAWFQVSRLEGAKKTVFNLKEKKKVGPQLGVFLKKMLGN